MKPGTRVYINQNSVLYNKDNSNPTCLGTITELRPISNYIYRVEWDNGKTNVYKPEDLVPASEKVANPQNSTEGGKRSASITKQDILDLMYITVNRISGEGRILNEGNTILSTEEFQENAKQSIIELYDEWKSQLSK